jgi:hypothetical protein
MQKVAYICDNKTNKHRAIMTIFSTSGKKAVKISQDASGMFRAAYVAIVSTGIGSTESLIELKSYNTQKAAEKFAFKVIG